MKKGVKDPAIFDLIMWAFLIFGSAFILLKYGVSQQHCASCDPNWAATLAPYDFSDNIVDAGVTMECSRSDEIGLVVINTPIDAVLNRQASYVQVSGGDSGTFDGTRINARYFGSTCFTLFGSSTPRCHDGVLGVQFDGRIPRAGVDCQVTYHLDFNQETVTTTTTTRICSLESVECPPPTTTTLGNGGIFTPEVIGIIAVIIMLFAGLMFIKSR